MKRECKLEDGKIVDYDLYMSDDEHLTPNYEMFEYLGRGKIYTINGQLQKGNITGRFYRQRKQHERK